MVFNFEVISSEKIGIGHQDKMGSSSIKWIMKLDEFHKKIKKTIVLFLILCYSYNIGGLLPCHSRGVYYYY